MSRVFVIESPTVNIQAAGKHGEIVILFREGISVSPLDTEYYAGEVIQALTKHNYDPNMDYVCIVGSVTSLAIVLPSILARWKAFRSLIFNAKTNDYVVRTLGHWRNTFPQKG